MEPRALPSAATPLLTMHALRGIVRDVRAIVRTLSMTDAVGPASAHLTRLASRIPGGSENLAPAWRNDIRLDNPHAAQSSGSLETRLLDDLYRFVQAGAGGGAGASGPVSTPPLAPTPGPGGGPVIPAPAPSLDAVRIQNTTGLDLLVTVHLKVPQIQQPWITEVIPAQGGAVVPFNFGTATDAFMTMDVRRADTGQSPPAFNSVPLPQPITGYHGALFTISLIDGYFNVTPV